MKMLTYIKEWYIIVCIIQTAIANTINANKNGTSLDGSRHSRVSGRIVKLHSEIQPESVTCISEGFLADPTDCRTFYRCIKASKGKYTILRFQCGPGTVYDPDTEVCNHSHSTKRSECRSSRPFQFIIAPVEQISDNDIEPAKELPSPITARKPLYSEQKPNQVLVSTTTNYPSLMTPVVPQNSVYGALSSINQEHETFKPQTQEILTTTTKYPTSKFSVVSTAYPWTSFTNQFLVTTVSSYLNSQHSNECTYDGFIGDYEDCRKFYRCVNNQKGGFVKYEFMCSESTIWDDDTQSCNHPWAVRRRRCARGDSINHTSSKFDEDFSQINKKNNETELAGYNIQATQAPVTASSTSRVASQINYEDRISSHEEISTKKNRIKENKVELQTQYPTIDKQTEYISSNSNPLSKTYYNTNLLHHVDKVPVYHTNYSKNEIDNFKCSESGFVGDPNDCRKFYRCIENGRGSYTKYEFSCGEGTVWDKNIESCNHDWMVKECGGKIISNSSPSAKPYDENAYITSTSSFISDNNGYNSDGYNLQKEKDKQENLNPSVLQQVNETLLKPDEVTVSQVVCNSTGYKGSKVDCKRFYRCIENKNGGFTKFEYMCDEGTVWDPDIEACNHAWIVKSCGQSSKNKTKFSTPSTEATIITTISFIQTTIQSNDINNENNMGFGPNNYTETTSKVITTTKMPINIENKCEKSGFMADNYDCRKFYRCVENGNGGFIQFEYSCGEGTVWDSEIVACNHYWAVKNCGYNVSNEVHEKIPIKPPPSDSVEEAVNIYSTETYKDTIRTTHGTYSTSNFNSATNNTTDSNKINICNNNGFIGDEYDCKKFYRCVSNGDGSYKQYEFSCGEGTVWDPSIESCNHAWAVKRCGGSSNIQQEAPTLKPSTTTHTMNDDFDNSYSTHSQSNYNQNQSTTVSSTYNTPVIAVNKECKTVGFFADENDCKIFYRCVNNEQGGFTRFEFSCGEGTVWDPKIGACNHASLVKDCGMMSITSDGNVAQPVTTTNLDVDFTTSSYSQNEATTTIKTPHTSNICIGEGFYSDYSNCKKFYRCVTNQQGGFDKYEFVCGEGTIWDQNIQACNHASNNKNDCLRPSATNITSTNKPTVAATEPSSTVNQPSPDLEDHSTQINKNSTSSTEVNCFADGFYPNPKDCKKFFRCVNNGKGGYEKYDFTCGEGTIWVQAIQACDHEIDTFTCSTEMSTVSEIPIFVTNITTPSDISSTQNEKPSKDESPTDTQSDSNILQNNKCHSEGYYASPNDCRKFYRCVINDRGEYTKYEYICGEGTAWDTDTHACNHITNVNRCQNTNALEVQVTSTAKYEKESKTTDNISAQKSTTLAPETTSRKESPSSNDNCNNEGYYGKKENCQMFYRCVDNGKGGYIKYDYICGEGTIWDQDILACNHPKDVTNPSCEQTTDGTSSTSTVLPVYSTTGSTNVSSATSLAPTETTMSSHESSSQGSVNCSGEENSKKPENQNVTCTKAGYFPNPNDCKKFYRCVDWDGDGKRFSVFHFECGEGTIWDPALDTCNYEESVYPPRTCGSQSQTNDSTSETSTVTDNYSTSVSMETTQQTQELTSIELTTMRQSSSSETTTTQSTITEVQSTTPSSSTSNHASSTSMSPTTTEQIVSEQPTTEKTTSTSDQTTTTDQITTAGEKSTTEQITTTSEKTTTERQMSSTTEQQTSTTTEQQTSSTTEQTSTEQSSTQTTESSTEKSTTKEETTTLQSTTVQQSSTELTTEKENSSPTTKETTSAGTSAPTENSSETTTEESSSNANNCPDTDSDQYLFACPTSFRRHPKYCNIFYQCLEDNNNHELKIAVFNCPNGTIYDESKIQCVEESKAEKKCQGSIAKDRRFKRLNVNNKEMIRVSGNKYKCPGIGHFPFEKSEECSPAFLKCEVSKTGKLRGFVFRCPENYVYWSISRRCEPISKMKECNRSPNQWDGRPEIPVERKNVA